MAGPERLIASPMITKMPVPMMAPRPIAVRLSAPTARRRPPPSPVSATSCSVGLRAKGPPPPRSWYPAPPVLPAATAMAALSPPPEARKQLRGGRYPGEDPALPPRRRLRPDRGPAQGDRRDLPGAQRRRADDRAARSHRHGQDDDDGRGHRDRPAPHAGHGPQQDAGRPAVQRVPQLLPRQRGRVLRLLLRLLPARGLRPLQGPVHREGLGDQRGDRSAAPRGHGGALRPARRG